MPKRRRLFTPLKNRLKSNTPSKNENDGKEEVISARGRLHGALMDVLKTPADDSDEYMDTNLLQHDRRLSERSYFSDEEERHKSMKPPQRQTYVLKLFDRSVDLSQFEEDTPLYPICRAWIANQPKADYSQFGKTYEKEDKIEDGIELPGPKGPPVTKIPELLPEQKASSKNNINLNYQDAALPSREQLLQTHAVRWAAVRTAWIEQSNKAEARYEATQLVLDKMSTSLI